MSVLSFDPNEDLEPRSWIYGSNMVELRDVFDRSFITTLRSDRLLGPVGSVLGPDEHLFVLADLARTLVVYDASALISSADLAADPVAEIPLVANEKLTGEVLLGKQLFANPEDKRMASEGYVSCASCHFDGFEDGLVWDFFDRGEGFRNTTSLLGRRGTGHGRVHWSAKLRRDPRLRRCDPSPPRWPRLHGTRGRRGRHAQ